ncbi:hypothetical protein M569_14221, partial [Genlisea aurea]
ILVAVDQSSESSNALSWRLDNLIFCTEKEAFSKIIPPLFLLFHQTHSLTAAAASAYPLSTSIIAATERYGSEIGEMVMEKGPRDSARIRLERKNYVAVETMVEHGDPR